MSIDNTPTYSMGNTHHGRDFACHAYRLSTTAPLQKTLIGYLPQNLLINVYVPLLRNRAALQVVSNPVVTL